MPKTPRFPGLVVLPLLLARALSAQTDTPTTVAAGSSFATEKSGIVSGVRIDVRPDGSVWFLLPALDRIAVLRGGQMTQWQIRDDTHLGANPVDFEVDGDVVWFIGNGESGVDAGHSIFGRLDTATGQEREWEIPGSRPAGFYRAPDGKVWLPQTDRTHGLQSVDLDTLEVVDHRSGNSDGTGTQTIAYSDIVLGPDGAVWMTDFGNNRIVRYEPGASQETSWTLLSPTTALLNPSQIKFDGKGRLWISELTGARMDRFDPATGELAIFGGVLRPIHFDLFGGRVYVAEATGSKGQIAVLDPLLAGFGTSTIQPETLVVRTVVNARHAVMHDRTITPTTFASSPEAIAGADLKVTLGIGVLRTEIPWTNAYGIEVVGGEVWVGSSGKLAKLDLQTIGGASDLIVPVATQLAGPVESEGRVDIMLYNPSDTPISGQALFLFSPGAFAARATFNVGPGQTSLVSDAFGDLGSATIPLDGTVRILVTSGPADQLVARVRAAKARADGGSFGYAVPALSAAQGLGSGSRATLFTGTRDSDTSLFGFYTPSGAEAVFTLVAPDGTVRATLPLSVTASNIGQEFQPAASAFSVPAEPGDVISVEVISGTLFPYVRIIAAGTGDTAISLPAMATGDAVFPNAGTAVGLFDTSFVSDLYLSNPDRGQSADVTIAYYRLGSLVAPATATLALAPGASQIVTDVLQTLFGVDLGQGTLLVVSNVPIASSLRIAAVKEEGDYATLALPIDPDGIVLPGGSAFVIGAPQTPTRRTNLLFFNRGAAGTVTVIGYNGNNSEIGRRKASIGDHQALRVDSVMAALGAEEERNGRLVVEASDGMRLYAWAAEVDGPTGDVEIIPFR